MNDLHLAVSLNPGNYRLGFEVPIPQKSIRPWREEVTEIAAKHGFALAEVMGGSGRTRPKSAARRACWAALRSRKWSLLRIAAVMQVDHTSVLHGLRRHAELSAAS